MSPWPLSTDFIFLFATHWKNWHKDIELKAMDYTHILYQHKDIPVYRSLKLLEVMNFSQMSIEIAPDLTNLTTKSSLVH